jgi:hypothetical protein
MSNTPLGLPVSYSRRDLPAEAIWENGAPIKCEILTWLAVQYQLWTSDRTRSHGLLDQVAACFVCLQDEDKADHIFTQCVHARQVLVQTLSNLNIAIAAPRSTCRLESWRQRARQGFSKKTRGNLGALVILGSWSLWKNRNVWVFGNMPNKECSAALKPNLQ